jgi:hypothetical protein
MTWVKLDDTCPDHPSIVGLSDAAFACWVRSLCYSSRHLTDGFIPTRAFRTLGTPKAARELEAAGRWEKVDGGVRVHGYEGKQRTRQQVEQERDKWKERQRRHRNVTDQSRLDNGESHGSVSPPELETETEVETEAVLSTTAAAPVITPAERQQRIDKACHLVAKERATHRPDVGPGWAPAAARGLATDHHQALHAHLVANPDATSAELAALIEHTARPERPNPSSRLPLAADLLAERPPADPDLNRAQIDLIRAQRGSHPSDAA